MGAGQSTEAGKRHYDSEEDEVDEEGFAEMKDPSNVMLPSPVRTKPSAKMSPQQVVENAVNDARKSFLEGNKLFREAQFDEAKQRYEQALRILREQLSTESEMLVPHAQHVQAAALSNIGILEFSSGRYTEAKDLLSEALALRQQEGHGAFGCAADPMDGLESLAIDLSRNRMFWQAPVTNHRLAAALKSHSSVDGVTADSLNNLAACMEVLGKLDEAKPLYEVRQCR
jgi:tetratricopeptide (TPR) repeat protein